MDPLASLFKNKIVVLLMNLFIQIGYTGAQHFEWLRHYPSQYSFNPAMVGGALCLMPGGVANVRLDSFALTYNQDAFGSLILENRDNSGNVLWEISLSNKVFVKRIVADQNGNIYLGGGFMDTLDFNGSNPLMNSGSGLNVDRFLAKLDANGSVIWKRNLRLTHAQTYLEDLQLDNQGNLWYAMNDFNNSALYKVDINGDDTDSLIQEGVLLVSSFSFDPFGNLFIAGAASNGTVTFGNQSYPVAFSYTKFIGRYDNLHNATWAYFAEDITFQESKIVSDQYGNAYMGGIIYDRTDFGTLHFLAPQWSNDMFLLKVDSVGNFLWGKSNPSGSAPFTGRFTPTSNEFIDVDLFGNVYIAGRSAGVLDWGNSVVMTAGLGQPHENRISVVSFDGNGNARWGKIFGSESYNALHTLKVSDTGECFFNAGFRDISVFDSTTFIGNSFINFVIGKISSVGPSNVHEINNLDLTIFPNPSDGLIRFISEIQELQLDIFDLMGRLILSSRINTGMTFDTGNLPDGAYLIRLRNGDRLANHVWIKGGAAN
ncbi:MAG TPA: T9SS type A sorting domain-containing protein [Bacteroidia bacterium]|nr:T9SS type A sorting domain-containing protein [Bacteroidia bacterium]